MTAADLDKVELASNFTVGDYRVARDTQNKGIIADAIRRRFKERYIDPVNGGNKHGFTMMAISCLMIESLETFRQGWKDSNGKSEVAFCYFFNSHSQFDNFRGH